VSDEATSEDCIDEPQMATVRPHVVSSSFFDLVICSSSEHYKPFADFGDGRRVGDDHRKKLWLASGFQHSKVQHYDSYDNHQLEYDLNCRYRADRSDNGQCRRDCSWSR
jgi:hypothetical protein